MPRASLGAAVVSGHDDRWTPPVLSTLSSKIQDQMATAVTSAAPDLLQRAVRLQVLTIVCMTVEAIVALAAAWTARSPALLGFGGDSTIELLSAIVVLWRFRSKSDWAVVEKSGSQH